MRQKPRNVWWLIVGVPGLSALGWLINSYPPTSHVILISFFVFLFISVFYTLLYLLNNVRRATLGALGLVLLLLLRYFQLRHPLYLILLVACLTSLEALARKR